MESRLREILESPSYRLAYKDPDFIAREDLRPLRLELELLKPQLMLREAGIKSTVVVFGGTQVVTNEEADARMEASKSDLDREPENKAYQRAHARVSRVAVKAKYYEECREFSRIVSSAKHRPEGEFVIATGGGPGIMEAANRGAHDVGAESIGLNITLPFEQTPNSYITPRLCFQFNYFALRKMHFLVWAKALVCFPGGFGTLDELFTALTLRQTQRMQAIPIILYGTEYWKNIINFNYLADEGVIGDDHLDLFEYTDSPEEAWRIIHDFHFSDGPFGIQTASES
jgi:uncharacterized protein (TIGR00730 family)